MNKLCKLLATSFVILGAQMASTAAMAQAAPDGVLTGEVVATKGITLQCDLTLTLDASNNQAEIALTPGNNNCAALSFENMPYATSYSPGVFTIQDVFVNTITLGDCGGDLVASWDGTILEIDTTLPAVSGGGDCTVEGFAS